MIHWKQIKLQNNESIIETSEKGNYMIPLIKSGQRHNLEPIKLEDIKVGDILFCKCKGSYYTYLVLTLHETKGCQISNKR
jgi:hypothetical protein